MPRTPYFKTPNYLIGHRLRTAACVIQRNQELLKELGYDQEDLDILTDAIRAMAQRIMDDDYAKIGRKKIRSATRDKTRDDNKSSRGYLEGLDWHSSQKRTAR